MYKFIKFTLFFAFLLLSVMACQNQENPTPLKSYHIRGTVLDTLQDTLLFVKLNEDFRQGTVTKIPILNGNINFDIQSEYPIGFTLFFGDAPSKSYVRYMTGFLDRDTITILLYPETDFDKGSIEGGVLNKEYRIYIEETSQKYDSIVGETIRKKSHLLRTNQYFSKEMHEIYNRLEKAETYEEKVKISAEASSLRRKRMDLTPEAKAILKKEDSLSKIFHDWETKYITRNTGIMNYYLFLRELRSKITMKKGIDFFETKRILKKFAKAHPGHPYNEYANKMLLGAEIIKVGLPFVDFSAPDLNGKIHTLSEEIKGKVAYIDLWATWCGSCIGKSRQIVPVYEDYKDKGFTIVGVACEFKDTKSLEAFLSKEKFPWLNLVELDHKNDIWTKYGIKMLGGSTYLVDKNGIVIAIDPTAEQVRKALDTLLP